MGSPATAPVTKPEEKKFKTTLINLSEAESKGAVSMWREMTEEFEKGCEGMIQHFGADNSASKKMQAVATIMKGFTDEEIIESARIKVEEIE